MHEAEYSLTLFRPFRRSPQSIFHRSGRKSDRRFSAPQARHCPHGRPDADPPVLRALAHDRHRGMAGGYRSGVVAAGASAGHPAQLGAGAGGLGSPGPGRLTHPETPRRHQTYRSDRRPRLSWRPRRPGSVRDPSAPRPGWSSTACAAPSGGLSRPAGALPGTAMTASMSAGRGSGSGVALHATPHIIAYGTDLCPGDHLPEDPRVRASSPGRRLTGLRSGEMRSGRWPAPRRRTRSSPPPPPGTGPRTRQPSL